VSCAYQGNDMNFYYAEGLGGNWTPTQEPISAGGTPSTGPVPPAIVTLADVPIVTFIGNDGDLYDQTRNNGTWLAANPHGVAGHGASITPAFVALTGGPELLAVYTDSAAHALMYTLRAGNTWTTPSPVSTASSGAHVSLAPLSAGGAVLAYVGLDGLLYTSRLSANAPYTWSSPVAGVNGSIPVLLGPPAVATGAAGAEAELLYVNSSAITFQSRMIGGAWSAPVMAGTSNAWLAIATGH